MSWRALSHAFAHVAAVPMSGPARLVLVALANRHHAETDRCGPSIAQLCRDTQYSEQAVDDALRELEALKLIITEERVQRTGGGPSPLLTLYHLKGVSQLDIEAEA